MPNYFSDIGTGGTNYIKSVSFVDYIDTSSAFNYWGVNTSENGEGQIVAWIEENGITDEEGNIYYGLYVGCKYKMYFKNMYSYFGYNNNAARYIESISFENVDTSFVNSMNGAFFSMTALKELDLSSFDTSNVKNMDATFANCGGLTSLNLSSFDTSNVTSMFQMFFGCKFETLDLSNFNISNVKNISQICYNCPYLKTVNFSNADFTNVSDWGLMLVNSYNITVIVKDEIQVNWFKENFSNIICEIATV